MSAVLLRYPHLRPALERVSQHLPQPVRRMFTLLLSLFTFRNILLLFCLLNLKTLPLAWELRLIYRSYRSWKSKRDVARILRTASNATTSSSSSTSTSTPTTLPASSHPLFAPLTVSTITPQLEIDHNLHKSNSTYFSDLDESRTALMVHLLSSTRFSPAELDREGYRGAFSIILGSVHASFLREIKPYERYHIRSRILGWDEKWILIGSVFVRSKTAADRKREEQDKRRRAKAIAETEGQKDDTETKTSSLPIQNSSISKDETSEVLLATCLSKYVVKKGRFTVPPERCWRSAGWLPDKPPASQGGTETPPIVSDSSAMPSTPDTEPVTNGEIKLTEADLRRRAQETAAKTVEKLQQQQSSARKNADDEACREAASKWSWEDIEAERKRGLKVAENWLGLDKSLKELWEQGF